MFCFGPCGGGGDGGTRTSPTIGLFRLRLRLEKVKTAKKKGQPTMKEEENKKRDFVFVIKYDTIITCVNIIRV